MEAVPIAFPRASDLKPLSGSKIKKPIPLPTVVPKATSFNIPNLNESPPEKVSIAVNTDDSLLKNASKDPQEPIKELALELLNSTMTSDEKYSKSTELQLFRLRTCLSRSLSIDGVLQSFRMIDKEIPSDLSMIHNVVSSMAISGYSISPYTFQNIQLESSYRDNVEKCKLCPHLSVILLSMTHNCPVDTRIRYL
jgi:hypothetical protein